MYTHHNFFTPRIFSAISFVVVLASFLQTSDVQADDENCDAILIQNVEYTSLDASSKSAFLSVIDENTWNQRRSDDSFRAELSQQVGKIPPFSASSSFSEFDESRKTYFQHINYDANAQSAFQSLRRYLSEAQIQAWADCVAHKQHYGLSVRAKEVRDNSVVLEVFWIKPPGVPEGPVPVTGTIIGGKAVGSGIAPGEVFASGQKLEQGSISLNLLRSETESLSIAINAGGFTANYSLSSRTMDRLQVASPVGTIVPSMLPPSRYGDATGDRTGFDPRRCAWIPADGRSVAGSQYANYVGSTVPDLRGQFLRGLNTFELGNTRLTGGDPDNNRTAGSFQKDEFKRHDHGGGNHTHESSKDKEWSVRDGVSCLTGIGNAVPLASPAPSPTDSIIKPEGGPETRPENIAIFYYIRIN